MYRQAMKHIEEGENLETPFAQLSMIHPLLRGGQPSSPHCFSKAQMEVFVALCDTLFPSIAMNDIDNSIELSSGDRKALSKSELQELEAFYRLSASDADVPVEAAGLITKLMTQLLKRSHSRLIHMAMWMLTSRLGTLVLGGKHAITSYFPFISNFAGLSQRKRHQLLLGFTRSHFYSKQELFRFFKCFVCWVIFTKVDALGGNPTFHAMKYQVGENEEEHQQVRDVRTKPALSDRVIDAKAAGEHLGAQLAALGVAQLDDFAHLKALRRRRETAHPYVEVGFKCDVVILGSGSGGAVVASRLAQAGHRVLILEKGDYFPAATLSHLEGPSIFSMYEGSGCLVTDDSRIILLAGATVGGGSTINWSASFRTPHHVRREWADAHCLDFFSSPAYDLAMDAVCSRLGVQSEVADENFQNGVLRRGCTALGYHIDNIPRNSPPDHQCGFCGLGCKKEKKQGAMLTWLEDAAASGAVVVAGCRAEEVLSWPSKNKMRRKVAGIVAEVVSERRITLYVEANVVVAACGALRTPPLLIRSGLRNRAIGRNLHIHPVQVVWGYFQEREGPAGKCYRGGIMTAYTKEAANWDTTGYGALIQCPASQPGIMGLAAPWISGLDFKARMLNFARTAFFIVLARDRGGGSVSADANGRLCVRYQLSNLDKESLREGAERGLRILVAAGASEVGSFNNDGEVFVRGGESGAASFEAFLARVRARSFQKLSTVTVSAHQMGSCRMGASPSTSAVRPSGETWEVEGLFVADSSVFPTATGVNPMITVQSIAYCTADSILRHLQNGTSLPHSICV